MGLGRTLTADDVSAPPELRAALLQVSQGVEHLHSLRIVHRLVCAGRVALLGWRRRLGLCDGKFAKCCLLCLCLVGVYFGVAVKRWWDH